MGGTRGKRVTARRVHKDTGLMEFKSSRSPRLDAAKLWKWPLDTVRPVQLITPCQSDRAGVCGAVGSSMQL